MAESVYKVIELVGTSTESWEKAATVAIKRAAKTLRDLRVAEISQLDMVLKDGKVEIYRAQVKVSFKYEGQRIVGLCRVGDSWSVVPLDIDYRSSDLSAKKAYI